ncbi:MAG: restriction endonuclease [Phototrophicales bacterium]|nr:MAG: restriction endonuclease [Phototrophicales bacterium]
MLFFMDGMRMMTMDATATRARMTTAEYFQLPETTQPQHLIDGEIIDMPPPIPEHQETVGTLFLFIKSRIAYIGGRVFFAPISVILSDEDAPEPDVCWIAPDGKAVVEKKYITGAPDFVAEVLSPSTARFDRRVKFRLYERFGVRELWLVDPAAQLIEVWRLESGKFQFVDAYGTGETFESTLFGAVEVSLIFPQPTPTA